MSLRFSQNLKWAKEQQRCWVERLGREEKENS